MTNPNSEHYTLSNKRFRAIKYDWDTLSTYGNRTNLYCLTEFQASWLLSNTDYLAWSSRWENCPCTDEDLALMASELEFALMSCIDLQPYQLESVYAVQQANEIRRLDDNYDGVNPNTINPDAPNDFFDGDASTERIDALCMACKIYCYSYASDWTAKAQLLLGITFAIGLVASISLIGAVVATVLVGGLAFITEPALNAMQDEDALDNVVCCMYNALQGLANTPANFETALDSCGFMVGSNEAIIRDIIASDLDQLGNWESFVNQLGEAFIKANAGINDCPCQVEWSHTWLGGFGTPTVDGWTIPTGTYNAGLDQIDEAVFNASSDLARTEYVIQAGLVTNILRMTFQFENENPGTSRNVFIEIRDDTNTLIQQENISYTGTLNDTIEWTGNQPVLEDWTLILNTSTANNAGNPHHARITSMTVEGNGDDPFA